MKIFFEKCNYSINVAGGNYPNVNQTINCLEDEEEFDAQDSSINVNRRMSASNQATPPVNTFATCK